MSDIVSWKTTISNPKLINLYASYVNAYADPTVDEKTRKAKFEIAESSLGRIQGARPVGKSNAKGIPDFQFSNSMLIDAFSSLGVGVITQAEAKLKRSRPKPISTRPDAKSKTSKAGTEIGSSVVVGSLIQQLESAASTTYNRQEIEELLGGYSSDEIKQIIMTNPELSSVFYNKSKFLQIFVQDSPKSPITAYNFIFSEAAFKSAIFNIKWRKDKKKFVTALSSTYENKLLNQLENLSSAIDLNTRKKFMSDINKLARGELGKKITGSTFANTGLTISFYTGGSIPMSESSIAYTEKIAMKPKEVEPVPSDSIVDITLAVKNKVKQRMRRGAGKPRPTKIYERTGAFRGSIRASFSAKQRTVDYFYEPYYQRLERSGYEITNLVEDSIRSVVQRKFKEQVTTRRINL
jgi:hypothetical protein